MNLTSADVIAAVSAVRAGRPTSERLNTVRSFLATAAERDFVTYMTETPRPSQVLAPSTLHVLVMALSAEGHQNARAKAAEMLNV